MTTFLSIIGLIALFIFGKFIYDTYLTNNTERDWEVYKQGNPLDAARIERKEMPKNNTRTRSREDDKRLSLVNIARILNCLPENAKTTYLQTLKDKRINETDLNELLQAWNKRKYEQSLTFKMNPDDTPAAFYEEWTISYQNNEEKVKLENVRIELLRYLNGENSNIDQNEKSLDEKTLTNYLDNNSNILNSDINLNIEAEKLRQMAVDKLFDENDCEGAILLINKGLELQSPDITSTLFHLRAECKKKLMDFGPALVDLDIAYTYTSSNSVVNNFAISNIFNSKAEIYETLGDYENAIKSREDAKKYYKLFERDQAL